VLLPDGVGLQALDETARLIEPDHVDDVLGLACWVVNDIPPVAADILRFFTSQGIHGSILHNG
jgi:hypothetical protein